MNSGRLSYGLFTVLLVFFTFTAAGEAGTIYIGPGGNCGVNTPCIDTIQSGIDIADAIATLEISRGTYIETLTFPTDTTFRQRHLACEETVTVDGSLTVQGGAAVFESGVFVVQDQGLIPVTVPDVVGLEKTAAESAVIAANLVVGQQANRGSDIVPANHIISQNPAEGASIAPGMPVDLYVSTEAGTMVVPFVAGMSKTEAYDEISEAALYAGTETEQHSDTTSAGRVINQSPLGGITVNWDVPVDLMISLGPSGDPTADPADVAPEIDDTVPASMISACEFLYTGTDPVQKGVIPGTIENNRIGVIRGQVMDSVMDPLSGVRVTVLNHNEYGCTYTRDDGMFDLAVNGGGFVTVNYRKQGYLAAQRQVRVPWVDYTSIPDVVMIEEDGQATFVDLNQTTQDFVVAQGSPVTDDDGTRQATLLFPQGATAEMVMPDGSRQPISTLTVGATEYSEGPDGPKAMPAQLPPTSSYTYCVEFSAEEVETAGAKELVFSQPIPFYVENFLGFPVGTQVPTASYDRDRGVWVPVDDGMVIKVLDESGGYAELDTTNDGLADNGVALGVTDEERLQIAALYNLDDELWRVPIPHFSPYDCNYGSAPPDDAPSPDPPLPPDNPPENDPNHDCGSIIEIQNQVLGERFPIIGTPFTLNYRSDRTKGGSTDLSIPLTGDTIHPELQKIRVEVQVAGREFFETFDPEANKVYDFSWVTQDAYGRTVQGEVPVNIRIGYDYATYYTLPPEVARSFGYPSGERVAGDIPTRETITLWTTQRTTIRLWDARGQGMGGWTLSVHHVYDPSANMLYRGDGRRHRAAQAERVIDTAAGTGVYDYGGDGGPATEAQFRYPSGLALSPDGMLYIADANNHCVRRIDTNGIITTVAGDGTQGYSGDNGPATSAQLYRPLGVAVAADGTLFIADTFNHCIRRVDANGDITTAAGDGTSIGGYTSDGVPATSAKLNLPYEVAASPDGSLYMADTGNHRVRQVTPDGIIRTVAGGGASGLGDGGPAIAAQLAEPSDVAVGLNGSLYIVDKNNGRIRRVDSAGIITTVAGGGGFPGNPGDGGPATDAYLNLPMHMAVGPDGSLYISDWSGNRVRRVDTHGTITTVAGTGVQGFSGDGGPAAGAQFTNPRGLAAAPDGPVYIADYNNHRIRKVGLPLPGFSDSDIAVASEDGLKLYRFDSQGRHLQTVHAITGAELYRFTYDDEGLLSSIEDGVGNITTIERNGQGEITGLIGPFGQETQIALNADGYIGGITNPDSEMDAFTYHDEEGLLATHTDPRNKVSEYSYNSGRLGAYKNPADGQVELSRLEVEMDDEHGNGYVVTKTTAEDVVTTYSVVNKLEGGKERVTTFADGTEIKTEIFSDGTRTITAPDGTVTTTREGPDPRWGMMAPVLESVTVVAPTGPSNLTNTYTRTLTATLTDPTDMLSLEMLADTETINGRSRTTTYDAATRTFTRISPEGREITTVVDNLGRVEESQIADFNPVQFAYDNWGFLTEITHGSGPGTRVTTFDYNGQGYLESITDPLLRATTFERDPAGRPTKTTLPGSREIQVVYDDNGNMTSITPPGRPAHAFTYTETDRMETYTAPPVGGVTQTSYAYNNDGLRATDTLPSGQQVLREYDDGGSCDCGHLSRLTYSDPAKTVTFDYDGNTGALQTVTAADGTTLTYGYDGFLLTDMAWSGTVSGSVQRTYNNDFRVVSFSVNGQQPINYQYDNDGFLEQVGNLSIDRDLVNANINGTALGSVTDARAFDDFGAPEDYQASFDGTQIFAASYARDQQGRIIGKTETIGAVTDTYTYTYDLAGNLEEVRKGGVLEAAYTYDGNGARTDTGGTHDNQDRLLQYGGAAYTYTPNGELESKAIGGQTTTYHYDELGNLVSVTLPDTRVITYVVDGHNRRIGKKISGSSQEQRFLYQNRLKPIAEMDETNSVMSRFIYATQGVVPDFMIKAGVTYRIISDLRGSPRLVVNTADGSIAQRLDYDAFGNIITDTNPGFQPFGFAGGLYDPDTGLVRFGARDYDAQTGRWTAKDPSGFAGGDTNLYRYAGNDPINMVDRAGQKTVPVYNNTSEWEYTTADGETKSGSGPMGGNKPGDVEGSVPDKPPLEPIHPHDPDREGFNKWDYDENDPFDPARGADPAIPRPDVVFPPDSPDSGGGSGGGGSSGGSGGGSGGGGSGGGGGSDDCP